LVSVVLLSLLFQMLIGVGTRSGAGLAHAAAPPVEARLKTLRGRCDHWIRVRIRVLDAGINRISKAKRITDEDKESLVVDLQTNKDDLNSLKEKIDAETDLEVLQGYARSIFVDYRIFMVVVPRSRGMFAVARFNYTIGKLEGTASKLESLINDYKQQGKDTSQAEGYLSALKTDLANAKSNVEQAKSTFSSMTPEKDEEARSMVEKGIASLRAAGADLKDASEQAKKIISWLKSL
jgi:hypothetical protein